MSNKLSFGTQVLQCVAPAAARSAASVNGNTIDKGATAYGGGGYWADGVAVLETGANTSNPTAISVQVKVQHSTDGTTFTDVTDTGIVDASYGELVAANGILYFPIRVASLHRYFRLVMTVAFTGGTSPTIFANASLLLGGARNAQ